MEGMGFKGVVLGKRVFTFVQKKYFLNSVLIFNFKPELADNFRPTLII